jgi:hypothetical protein
MMTGRSESGTPVTSGSSFMMRIMTDTGRDERLDLVHRVKLAGQPFQHHGIDAGPQNLDRDPLSSRPGAAAEVDDALAALAEPPEAAQPLRVARLQWSDRHRFSGDRSAPLRREKSIRPAGHGLLDYPAARVHHEDDSSTAVTGRNEMKFSSPPAVIILLGQYRPRMP